MRVKEGRHAPDIALPNEPKSIERAFDDQVLKCKLIVDKSVLSADLEGETVLLNLETGVYFGLDEVGTAIWNALEAGASVDEIVSRLLEEFEVEADRARSDVSKFLSSLEERGLIVPSAE
jgi:hypothetical protein